MLSQAQLNTVTIAKPSEMSGPGVSSMVQYRQSGFLGGFFHHCFFVVVGGHVGLGVKCPHLVFALGKAACHCWSVENLPSCLCLSGHAKLSQGDEHILYENRPLFCILLLLMLLLLLFISYSIAVCFQ